MSPDAGLTYQESTAQAKGFVDPPLGKALAGAPFPQAEIIMDQNCVTYRETPSGKVYPVFTYRFPLTLLGENPERLIQIAESSWRAKGFEVRNGDEESVKGKPPEVLRRYASLERGFTAYVMVNYLNDLALISASGPCAKPPAEA